MLIIFFYIKGIVRKEFILAGDCLKMCGRFRPELWGQKYRLLLHHDSASFFIRDLLTKDNMTVVPHPFYFSVFPQIEDKTKRPPF
jgi:hypothetical protein